MSKIEIGHSYEHAAGPRVFCRTSLTAPRCVPWSSGPSWLAALAVVAASVSSTGCWQSMCSPGEIERELFCVPAPVADAAADAANVAPATDDAAPSETDSATASAPADSFGKACTTPSDCSGKSPVCAPAPLGYCTNLQCSPGEANAGVCPAGFMCFPAAAGNPSACVKSGG